MAMSLACLFGEPSFESIERMPAQDFDSWRKYASAIGGVTPPFAEIIVFAMLRIGLWQGSHYSKEPLQFKDVFLPLVNRGEEAPKEQTPEQMISLLKAFAVVHNPKQNRNCDNGGELRRTEEAPGNT